MSAENKQNNEKAKDNELKSKKTKEKKKKNLRANVRRKESRRLQNIKYIYTIVGIKTKIRDWICQLRYQSKKNLCIKAKLALALFQNKKKNKFYIRTHTEYFALVKYKS